MTGARDRRLAELAARAAVRLGRIRAAWSGDADTHGVLWVAALQEPRGEMAIARCNLISEAERLADLLNVLCDFVETMEPQTIMNEAPHE